jgi:hypothetical protein
MVVKQKNFEMLSDEQKILGMAGVWSSYCTLSTGS